MENVIGTTEAAEVLDVDPATVTRMVKDGRLTARKLPGATGAYVFDLAVVERLRDARTAAAAEATA
jgi:excisionase family DNA binding protein